MTRFCDYCGSSKIVTVSGDCSATMAFANEQGTYKHNSGLIEVGNGNILHFIFCASCGRIQSSIYCEFPLSEKNMEWIKGKNITQDNQHREACESNSPHNHSVTYFDESGSIPTLNNEDLEELYTTEITEDSPSHSNSIPDGIADDSSFISCRTEPDPINIFEDYYHRLRRMHNEDENNTSCES